jgi:hypothetical protein
MMENMALWGSSAWAKNGFQKQNFEFPESTWRGLLGI